MDELRDHWRALNDLYCLEGDHGVATGGSAVVPGGLIATGGEKSQTRNVGGRGKRPGLLLELNRQLVEAVGFEAADQYAFGTAGERISEGLTEEVDEETCGGLHVVGTLGEGANGTPTVDHAGEVEVGQGPRGSVLRI